MIEEAGRTRTVRKPLQTRMARTFSKAFNPLKPQSNGHLCRNTVIGTLAVDGLAVTFGTARDLSAVSGLLLAVPNITAPPPSTASVPTSYYSMWEYKGLKQPNLTTFIIIIEYL